MDKEKSFSVGAPILNLALMIAGSTLVAGCVVPVHASAKAGNMWELKQHFAWGANPNAKTLWCRDTPLHFAAAHGRVEAVKFLLEKGADVNFKNEGGEEQVDQGGGIASGSRRFMRRAPARMWRWAESCSNTAPIPRLKAKDVASRRNS